MKWHLSMSIIALTVATQVLANTSTIFSLSPTPTWTTIPIVTSAAHLENATHHTLDKRLLFFTTDFAWPGWLIGDSHGYKFEDFRAIAENATEDEIKFQPVLDYDKDSCYNQPAINLAGKINEGLTSYNTKNTWGPGCRNVSDLDNQNVYARSRCNNGWCAYMYEHYWRKDVDQEGVEGPEGGGHRHEWENAVVFVRDGEEMPAYVAVSDGDGYNLRPRSKVRFLGTHAKLVYHKWYVRQHCLRFANKKDDNIENAHGIWMRGALIGWNNWPSVELRATLIDAFSNVNQKVKPKLNECFFSEWLKKAAKHKITGFNPMPWECKRRHGANEPYGLWEQIKWLGGYNDPPEP